jgi:hypothetical protein
VFLVEKLFTGIVEINFLSSGQIGTELTNSSNMLVLENLKIARETRTSSIFFEPMNGLSKGLLKFNTSSYKFSSFVFENFIFISDKTPNDSNNNNCIDYVNDWIRHNSPFSYILAALVSFIISFFCGSGVIETRIKYLEAKKRHKQIHKETMKSIEEALRHCNNKLAPNGVANNPPPKSKNAKLKCNAKNL